MALKEDMAAVRTDVRWMKKGLEEIHDSVHKVAGSVEKVAEVASNNRKEIARIKGVGMGIGAVTVLISVISFFMAIGAS